ncbi:MAG: galactokinase family protein [Saprospiraceae bacterium]
MGKAQEIVRQAFIMHFGNPEFYCFSPGRANILGEHIDYNGGIVLPFAISNGIHFFAKITYRNHTKIYALNTDEWYSYSDDTNPIGWANYFKAALDNKGLDFGLQICFGGDLPIGAGLSSSSAIVCGLVYLLDTILKGKASDIGLLDEAIKIERGNGVLGGVMDQTAIFFGRKDSCMILDCKTNKFEYAEIDPKWHFYLFDTRIKHELVQSDYNVRAMECQEALYLINFGKIDTYRYLTDIPINTLNSLAKVLSSNLMRRVTYVIEEQIRVIKAIHALHSHDIRELGALMYQSHFGLCDSYEVSWPEADWLVNFAQSLGIVGARMMGGGFGGCTINLSENKLNQIDIQRMKDLFYTQFGNTLDIYEVKASHGILACTGQNS